MHKWLTAHEYAHSHSLNPWLAGGKGWLYDPEKSLSKKKSVEEMPTNKKHTSGGVVKPPIIIHYLLVHHAEIHWIEKDSTQDYRGLSLHPIWCTLVLPDTKFGPEYPKSHWHVTASLWRLPDQLHPMRQLWGEHDTTIQASNQGNSKFT